MAKHLPALRRELALILALFVALCGTCALASTGQGNSPVTNDVSVQQDSLARGDQGATVEELQARLMELGYLSGAADGVYGAQTEDAVRAFQAEAGLEETGVADAETLEALNAASAPAAPDARDVEMVWIPRTGQRYHSNKNCSGMKDPSCVSIDEAVRRGFTPCKKCYG